MTLNIYFSCFVVGVCTALLLVAFIFDFTKYLIKWIDKIALKIYKKHYIEYNVNPGGNRCGDCGIRAASKVLNISWYKVFNEVSKIAHDHQLMMETQSTLDLFYRIHNLKKFEITKYHVLPFLDETFRSFARKHQKGKYILVGFIGNDIRNLHACAVCNGKLYDTFYSGSFKVRYVYEKSDKK